MSKLEKKVLTIGLMAAAIGCVSSLTINVITHAGLMSWSAGVSILDALAVGIIRIIIMIKTQHSEDGKS